MADHKYPGYQAWLPPRVRYDEKLSPAAKLLFCEISAMTDVRGYCWATNRYLAALLRITKVHVGRLLSDLAGRGYITSEVIRSETGEVKERRIYVSDQAMATIPPPYKNVDTPPVENVDTPPHKNVEENVSNKEHTPYSPPRGTRARKHKKTADWEPDTFEKLWKWYPGDPARHNKRGNRQRAIRAWDNLSPSPELIETMSDALARQADSEEWREGIGIPHLSTYLNGAGWEGWESEAS
jgi:hypothetical protein